MSIDLHPGIGELDPGSLCHSLYRQLYQHFFNAQDRKDAEHPFGIEEGDDTSLRLHNTAYGFAEAIAGSVAGEGGSGQGGILLDYLKRSGGDMAGPLTADYGFGAGVGNHRVLETYRKQESSAASYGVRVQGDLDIRGREVLFGGSPLLRYDGALDAVFIHHRLLNFSTSAIQMTGLLLVGEDLASGVYIAPSRLKVCGHDVFHGGNADRTDTDWTMRDGTVAGTLRVTGAAELAGTLRAVQGVELGAAGKVLLSATPELLSAFADLAFAAGAGVRFGGVTVLKASGAQDVRIEGAEGDLLVGGDHTGRVRLMSNLTDIDGEHVLLSRYGEAYFPGSLRVQHNYSRDLLSSYRNNNGDMGITIHERLRFGDYDTAPTLLNGWGFLGLIGNAEYTENGQTKYAEHATLVGFIPSESRYAPGYRRSDAMVVAPDADQIVTSVPIEATDYIGFYGALTRLTEKALFFTDDIRLQHIADGIRHYGNAYFEGSLSSGLFTSGMAGSGWAILCNGTTGNASATFDELTVRKRMRVYELEVQRAAVTNGSLWVTDACSGDHVEKL